MTHQDNVVLRDQLLGVGCRLRGLGAVVFQDQLDLFAIDSAGSVDPVNIDAQRLDGRRISARRRPGQRAG